MHPVIKILMEALETTLFLFVIAQESDTAE